MRVLIIGCGYVGLPLGQRMVSLGHEVWGLKRSGPEVLQQAGIQPLVADVGDPASLAQLPSHFDWVVFCAAAGGGGDYRRVYLEGMRNVVAWLGKTPPQKLVYTSSTSVYAQNDGSWVDEMAPAMPAVDSGRILVETESVLRSAFQSGGFPGTVLRVAGIYGPGRGYWFKQFLSGEAVLEGDGSRFLNMIHRDDVGGAILTALEHGQPGEIYNACDDEPVSQRDLFGWLASELGRPMPPRAAAGEETAARRRGATNKRISNRKLRAMGWTLCYPTFREGFRDGRF
jgi:nucleoside-diphosphate-sugar epimerase